ncbi:MAG TPA: IgGFc-binding protein [Polyangiaceae bacterium]|nr:IgGFc-binding protein [Polyangiaceae bacterium]
MFRRACGSALLTALLACGGSGSNYGDAGGVDGSVSDGGGLDVGNPFPDSGFGDGGGTRGCSGDLRSVIDGSGNVIQTCPPDQGCSGGTCVPACQAAADSKGTVGCDYVVPTPSFYDPDKPPCFAIFVANNWPKEVQITVTRGGTSYNVTSFGRIAQSGQPVGSWQAIPSTGLPPGDVAVLFMSHDPQSVNLGTPLTCPITPAISQTYGTAISGSGGSASVTGKGTAWHLTTDVPVTSYDILPYGGASSYLPSATLLLPTTAWGTNYFGIVAARGTSGSPQWGQIVASQNGTHVTVLPNVALPSGTGVAPAPANTATVYTLDAGDYVQWQDSNEMSGTVIQSTNPIGFVGGSTYDCYTSTTDPSGGGCDSAHQQMPPISALGSEYVVAPYTTRMASLADESEKYRFVGAVAGTTLTYDPAVAGAPATLTEGQVVDFETKGSFVVEAQDDKHPFYVAQMMTGCSVNGGSRPGCSAAAISKFTTCCLGDEEYVNILPPAQFLQKYVFFSDPTYPTTNLVFTREKTAAGFVDVNLNCLGQPLTGWKPVGTSGKYEFTNVDLIRAGTKNGACDNGPQVATSNGPFGVTVWGLDSFSSYAYPAGGNVAPINSVVVPPTPH